MGTKFGPIRLQVPKFTDIEKYYVIKKTSRSILK